MHAVASTVNGTRNSILSQRSGSCDAKLVTRNHSRDRWCLFWYYCTCYHRISSLLTFSLASTRARRARKVKENSTLYMVVWQKCPSLHPRRWNNDGNSIPIRAS